jgi:hypothetical protein
MTSITPVKLSLRKKEIVLKVILPINESAKKSKRAEAIL